MELKFFHRSKKFHHFHFHLLLHETFNIWPPNGDDDIVPLVLNKKKFQALDYFHDHFFFALALAILFIPLLIFLIFHLVLYIFLSLEGELLKILW